MRVMQGISDDATCQIAPVVLFTCVFQAGTPSYIRVKKSVQV